MIPTTDHLPALAALLADVVDGDEDAAYHRRRLDASHAEDLARIRATFDADGTARALLRIFVPAPQAYWLTTPRHRPGAAADTVGLLDALVALADARGWSKLATRVEADRLPGPYLAALGRHGFAVDNERVEYKTPLDALPPEGETPLQWVPLDAFGHAATADVIDRAGRGPEWEADDTGESVLAHALGQEHLYREPDCVQVGLLDGEPAAFVIAQVEPPTGWSTLTFLGVVPAFRGRGLGPFVHRRGMALLRAQGGTLYHGGTSATNHPMVRLFERHGCRLHARLTEYVRRR